MNYMLKIISIVLVTLTLLSGCTSQNNPSYGQNFDQLKAAKTRVSLGLTYLKNGNFSQAKYNLDKALEFAPRSADAHFAMAYYYQSVSELEQAENAYQIAMDFDPQNANIANSYGAFLCQNGDYEKAKTYFLKAVNTSSYVSSAETYENLAMCSQNQGRPEDSIQYLRSAVNHQPGRASSLYLLAQSLVETQQWQEARGILRRYEKVSQISPQSLLLAMKIEQGTGNEAAAQGYLDMLLRIFPNDPITKSSLADRYSSSKMNGKTDNLPDSIQTTKTSLVGVESPATVVLSNKVVIVPEKLSERVAEVESEVLDAAELPERVADHKPETLGTPELPERVTEVKPEAVDTTELPEVVAEVEPEVLTTAELPERVAEVTPETLGTPELSEREAEVEPETLSKPELPEIVSEAAPNTPDTPEFHVVAKGENLYRISLLYNIKMQRLIDWNGLVDESAIYEGKKLSLVAPSVVE